MKSLIKITLFFFALVMTIGCEKDYVAKSDLVDVSWYTSIVPGTDYVLAVDKHVSFMDISQGAISHKWELVEGAGTYFLGEDFYGKDTLMDYVDHSMGFSTSEPTVHVLFSKGGLQTIRLYNEFPRKVSYSAEMPFESKKVGDVWVIDTTFTIDVFADMLPAFQVFQVLEDGMDSLILDVDEDQLVSKEDTANWQSVEVEAGTVLKYVDMTTTDRPTGREWSINRGNGKETFTDSVVEVSYLKLGQAIGGSIKSEREESGSTPKGTATKQIPLKVKVTPSNKPFEYLGEMQEQEDETISFRVSGEVASITDGETAFTVHVKNTSGFDRPIDVLSAKINANDASIIDLSLLESIYNSDEITVSFDNTIGTIVSTDSRTLQSFSGEVVAMYFENAADPKYFSAEDPDGWFLQHAEQWFINNENAVSGNSFKFYYNSTASPANKAKAQSTGDNTLGMTPGNYKMRMSIYIEENSSIGKLSTNLSTPDWLALVWDLTAVEKGKWVILEDDVAVADHSKFILQVATADVSSDEATMYIDDIEFVTVETRP